MFLSKRMNCLLSKWVLFTTVTLSTRPTDVKLDSAFLTRVLCTVLCPEIDSHAGEKCAKIICAANMICFAPLLKIMIHQLSRNFIVGLAYKSQATFFFAFLLPHDHSWLLTYPLFLNQALFYANFILYNKLHSVKFEVGGCEFL